jgi:hypothetical protein
MATSLYDKQAVKILFTTYWSSGGWKKDRTISPEDFTYAKNKGVMFDERTIRHDEIVQSAQAMAGEIDHQIVADAFLLSLGSRELAYRSALGSFAVSRWLPKHSYAVGRFQYICKICGNAVEHKHEDLSVLNFERLKWGGVRHLHPYYAWFDLAEFRKLSPAKPTANDRDVLKRVLDIASSQAVDARPGDLEKATAGLFPSSKDERRNVLQILGYCGILQPVGHPTFFQNYAQMEDRAQPTEHKNDWSFPFLWWRGRDGVNSKAVEFYFSNL